jgi:hypothetical protein
MDPDDQRHAPGIAAGWEVEIEPLAAVAGLALRGWAVWLVAVRREAGGILTGRRNRCGRRGSGLDRLGNGRAGCRQLDRQLDWQLVERLATPGAAPL